ALPLDQDPVLVPVREEIGAEGGEVEIEGGRVVRVERAPRERLGLAQIDVDAGAEGELLPRRLHELTAVAVQAPEGRPQARVGTLLRRVEPQRARDVRPVERTLV